MELPGADASGWPWLPWYSLDVRGVLERYGFAGEGELAKYIKRSAPSSLELDCGCVGVFKRLLGVATLSCVFCNVGVVCSLELVNDGDGFNVAWPRGGVSGGASSKIICECPSPCDSLMDPRFLDGVAETVLEALLTSLALRFNGDDDKYTLPDARVCGDRPPGRHKCVGDDDNIMPPCGDISSPILCLYPFIGLALGTWPTFMLVGEIDCLAAIVAFESFRFNCLAIFSSSSFLSGVLGFPVLVALVFVELSTSIDAADDVVLGDEPPYWLPPLLFSLSVCILCSVISAPVASWTH